MRRFPRLVSVRTAPTSPVRNHKGMLDIVLRPKQPKQAFILWHNCKIDRCAMLAAEFTHRRKRPQYVAYFSRKCSQHFAHMPNKSLRRSINDFRCGGRCVRFHASYIPGLSFANAIVLHITAARVFESSAIPTLHHLMRL